LVNFLAPPLGSRTNFPPFRGGSQESCVPGPGVRCSHRRVPGVPTCTVRVRFAQVCGQLRPRGGTVMPGGGRAGKRGKNHSPLPFYTSGKPRDSSFRAKDDVCGMLLDDPATRAGGKPPKKAVAGREAKPRLLGAKAFGPRRGPGGLLPGPSGPVPPPRGPGQRKNGFQTSPGPGLQNKSFPGPIENYFFKRAGESKPPAPA